MSLAEIFYVDGMIAICLGFPSALVFMAFQGRVRPAVQLAKAPKPQTQRHAHNSGSPYSA